MANPSLLQSSTSSFLGQFRSFAAPLSAAFPYGNRNGAAVVSVKATAAGVVLVEKNEAEKSNRLKATYREKIVPKLMEEFSYTNILQVIKFSFQCIMGISQKF